MSKITYLEINPQFMNSFLEKALVIGALAMPAITGCEKKIEKPAAPIHKMQEDTRVMAAQEFQSQETELSKRFGQDMAASAKGMATDLMTLLQRQCGGLTGKFVGKMSAEASKGAGGYQLVGFIELDKNPITQEVGKCIERTMGKVKEFGRGNSGANCVVAHDAPHIPKDADLLKLDRSKMYLPFSINCSVE